MEKQMETITDQPWINAENFAKVDLVEVKEKINRLVAGITKYMLTVKADGYNWYHRAEGALLDGTKISVGLWNTHKLMRYETLVQNHNPNDTLSISVSSPDGRKKFAVSWVVPQGTLHSYEEIVDGERYYYVMPETFNNGERIVNHPQGIPNSVSDKALIGATYLQIENMMTFAAALLPGQAAEV